MNILKKHRNILLLLIDMCMVFISDVCTYFIFINEYRYLEIGRKLLMHITLIDLLISSVVFLLFKFYRIIWRYARIRHLAKCFTASLVSVFLCSAFNIITEYPVLVPLNAHFIRFLLLAFFVVISRIAYISSFSYYKSKIIQDIEKNDVSGKKRLLIVGAGEMASLFFDDLGIGIPDIYKPVCIVDDDPAKLGRKLGGVTVIGKTDDIPKIVKEQRIDTIIVCINHIDEANRKRIFTKCNESGCTVSKMTLGVNENVENKIKKVSINDLLGRATINLENNELKSFINNKTVMVTGGGGSIGSELCRHIAVLNPRKLIIVDNYENSAYDIQQELLRKHGKDFPLSVEIVSVCDEDRMRLIFSEYRPDILYHAAAHKHVPLMEHNPEEAVKNNVFGTYITANLASEFKVEKFILVSTDKAVNPTNIMGATKRCCEIIVQSMNTSSETDFVAVRFGNVLGSNGSVIPLFEKQIANGGPVTVTHPDIIRYFMTIPEAVQLLLAAGSMATGGEIFVLDMGEPVKIAELAKQMIRLSGLIPDKDIEIKYTGLRPGEKLYEELLMSEEGLKSTNNKKIFIGKPNDINKDIFFGQLEKLKLAAFKNDISAVSELISEIVPTYHQPERDKIAGQAQ